MQVRCTTYQIFYEVLWDSFYEREFRGEIKPKKYSQLLWKQTDDEGRYVVIEKILKKASITDERFFYRKKLALNPENSVWGKIDDFSFCCALEYLGFNSSDTTDNRIPLKTRTEELAQQFFNKYLPKTTLEDHIKFDAKADLPIKQQLSIRDDEVDAPSSQTDRNIKGKYAVWYQADPIKIRPLTKDELILAGNDDANLTVRYFHEVDEGIPQEWQGTGYFSPVTRAVFISAVGPGKEKASSIFLILNIPAAGRKFDTLTGVISGISNRDEGALAILVVATKNPDDSDLAEEKQQIMKDYFKAFENRSYIPTTTPIIANMQDLKNTFNDHNQPA
ncbi:MAG: hypothetical protein INR73_17940 [Williamsia sp.]|nr:hypothetical protein [Williamsia sp.]